MAGRAGLDSSPHTGNYRRFPGARGKPFGETGARVRRWEGTSAPQEVRMAVEQSGAEASPAPESRREEAAEEAAANSDLDETKRQLRAALERKRSTHATTEGADHTGQVPRAHGPVAR